MRGRNARPERAIRQGPLDKTAGTPAAEDCLGNSIYRFWQETYSLHVHRPEVVASMDRTVVAYYRLNACRTQYLT